MPPKAQTRAKTMGYIRVYRLIFQDMPRCCAWTHVQSWHGPREARKEGRISAQMIAWEMETFYKRSGALNLDSGDGRGVKRSKARWESSAVAWHLPEPIALDMLICQACFSACQHPVMWCAVQYIYILSEFFDMLQPKVQPPVSDCFYVLVPSVTAGNIQHTHIYI